MLKYYLTLFRIEGHQTYRSHLGGTENSHQQSVVGAGNHPKVTEKKVFVIDRITGEVKELK